MIDTPKYKLAKKRIRYGLYGYAVVVAYAVFVIFLSFVDPVKYALGFIEAFGGLALVLTAWSMRLSGRHEMNEEREAHE